jgi:hypothetical protein
MARRPRLAQYPVEHIGGLFARKDGYENTTTPDWINKAGGVPREHPAVIRKLFVSKRKISGRVNFGHAARSRHLLNDHVVRQTTIALEFLQSLLPLALSHQVLQMYDH